MIEGSSNPTWGGSTIEYFMENRENGNDMFSAIRMEEQGFFEKDLTDAIIVELMRRITFDALWAQMKAHNNIKGDHARLIMQFMDDHAKEFVEYVRNLYKILYAEE